MKIGLFLLEVGRNVGGLEVYEVELARALAKIDRENQYVIFCFDPRVPSLLGIQASNFRFKILPGDRFTGVLARAPLAFARERIDLFHATFVPPPFTSIPYVITQHGTETLTRLDFYPWLLGLRMNVLIRRGMQKAAAVLCVAEYIHTYLRDEMGIPDRRLVTTLLAAGESFGRTPRSAASRIVAQRLNLDFPYILVVGRIEPRKNPVRALEAYSRVKRTGGKIPKLVFAGAKTWTASEFDRTKRELGLQDDVVELGHLPHEDLPALYSAAELALFPSLWEGFGFPAMEALRSGTPLVTSRVPPLIERVGDAGILVDPDSPEELAAAMLAILRDESLRNDLVRKGLARAAGYSWEKTALRTLEAYANCCASGRGAA